MVVATQNPIEQQGVYPLPEAQLDRFLFKQTVDYPSAEEERRIIATHGARKSAMEPEQWGVERKADSAAIGAALAAVGEVKLVDEVIDYISALIRGTRDVADLETGASPRAGAMLAGAARARAALDGRDFVIPDDVKIARPGLAPPPPDPVARRRDQRPGGRGRRRPTSSRRSRRRVDLSDPRGGAGGGGGRAVRPGRRRGHARALVCRPRLAGGGAAR